MACMRCGGNLFNNPYIATCVRCTELQRYKSECLHLRDLLNEAKIRIKHYKAILNEKTDSDSESDMQENQNKEDRQETML